MKFYVRTYGCQMNAADSNEMGRHLKANGLVETQDPDEASVILVNTCTVRQHAEDRAFSEIGRLKKWKAKRPGRKIVVTGCAAERTKEYLEDRFPFLDLVVGAKSIEDFSQMTAQLLDRRETDEELDYAVPAVDDRIAAFVTIMRGCNYSCTYCIVPYVRGREIYHSMEQILGEARDRVAEGAREITLLGQTVNSYRHGSYRFAELLEAVSNVDGVDRVRFISPHPYYMSDRVVETMARVPEVCESLHLPVQSGSNTMLRQMMRNYTREQYQSLVEKLRKAMPGMSLSTDIIVGFPGETEADFRQTLSLIEEARFDWGFIFKYSPREGTPAASMESLPLEVIEERHRECLELLDRLAVEKRSKLVGTTPEVLVEEGNFGRTRTNYKVHITGNVAPGEEVRVQITNAQRATLEGVIENGNITFENFRKEDSRAFPGGG
ncbi:MAG TPA: tRNA (N6-isopentenyl adenosine(37)-C2)-methylthiotransferase MiaB [Terriglobia bacterium]|nr:tRNA (N6-isopentenyl adenosine(37)-C2)-methylthiotransferase MiaB [Terriglobia bacterium]